MRRYRPSVGHVLAPAVSGLLLLLAYPPFNLAGLAWIALVPLLAAWRTPGPSLGRLWIGTLFGGLVWGGGLFYPLLSVEDGSLVDRVAGTLVVTFLLTFFLLFFAILYQKCTLGQTAGPLRSAVIAPALWIGLEYVWRSLALGFAPYLGLTQWQSSFALDVAAYGGVHLVSGMIVGMNGVTLLALKAFRLWAESPDRRVRGWAQRQRARGGTTLAVAVFVAVLFSRGSLVDLSSSLNYGGESLTVTSEVFAGSRPLDAEAPDPSSAQATAFTLVAVQPGFTPQDYREALQGGEAGQLALLQRVLALSREGVARAERSQPILVVWPETTLHIAALANSRLRTEILAFVSAQNVTLLAGLPRWTTRSSGVGGARGDRGSVQHNSAQIVTALGHVHAVYDKISVIPIAEAQYEAGREIRPVRLFDSEWSTTIGIGICSDVVDPRLARAAVRAGAQSLHYVAALSRIGSLAHLERAFLSFRAAEHRIVVTQAATTGPTLVVGPTGAVEAQAAIDVESTLIATVPAREGEATLYTRWGDWPVGAGLILLLGMGALDVWSGRRRRGMLFS